MNVGCCQAAARNDLAADAFANVIGPRKTSDCRDIEPLLCPSVAK
jgi:hypothetical protein